MAFTEVSPNIYAIDGLTEDGAEFIADLSGVAPILYLLPFLGGVPDSTSLSFSPYLEDGASLGARVDLAFGFKWEIVGGPRAGWTLYCVDAQAAKVVDVLGDYLAPGWQFVLRFEKAAAPAPVGDFYEFPKFILSGDRENYNFARQPPLLEEMTQQQIDDEGHTRPEHIVEAFVVTHKTKVNTVRFPDGSLRDDYRAGQAGFIVRPYLHAMDGATVLGSIPGKWRKEILPNGDILGIKQFDKVAVQALLAAHPTATHAAVDATYGYDTEGGSQTTNTYVLTYNVATTEEGVVNSLDSYRTHTDDVNWDVTGGLYPFTTSFAGTDALLTNSGLYGTNGTTPSGNFTRNASGTHNWVAYTSNAPTIPSGKKMTIYFNQTGAEAGGIKYNSGLGANYDSPRYTAVPPGNAPPDPVGSPASTLAGFAMSQWVDYTVAASPPVVTNVVVSPTSVAAGVSSALSADITADSTITAAEYITSNVYPVPAAGSGIAMTLGAGTTSREASATINTSILPHGTITVSVRGYTVDEGWGDLETVELTVTVPGLTIGSTTVSTSAISAGNVRVIGEDNTASEDGTITSVTIQTLLDCTQAGNENRVCIYKGATGDANTLVANSDVGDRLADSVVQIGQNRYLCTWEYAEGSRPVITSGDAFSVSSTNGSTRPYAVNSGGSYRFYNNPIVEPSDAPADPAGTPNGTVAWLLTGYATYVQGLPPSSGGGGDKLSIGMDIGI